MSKQKNASPAKKGTDKKTKTPKAPKVKQTAEEKEAATIAKAEQRLVEKHGNRIVKGSVRRADKKNKDEAKYGNKLLVTINTIGVDGKPDGKTLTVATSDVHQVKHTPEVKAALQKAQREEAKKDKAEATATK